MESRQSCLGHFLRKRDTSLDLKEMRFLNFKTFFFSGSQLSMGRSKQRKLLSSKHKQFLWIKTRTFPRIKPRAQRVESRSMENSGPNTHPEGRVRDFALGSHFYREQLDSKTHSLAPESEDLRAFAL